MRQAGRGRANRPFRAARANALRVRQFTGARYWPQCTRWDLSEAARGRSADGSLEAVGEQHVAALDRDADLQRRGIALGVAAAGRGQLIHAAVVAEYAVAVERDAGEILRAARI